MLSAFVLEVGKSTISWKQESAHFFQTLNQNSRLLEDRIQAFEAKYDLLAASIQTTQTLHACLQEHMHHLKQSHHHVAPDRAASFGHPPLRSAR